MNTQLKVLVNLVIPIEISDLYPPFWFIDLFVREIVSGLTYRSFCSIPINILVNEVYPDTHFGPTHKINGVETIYIESILSIWVFIMLTWTSIPFNGIKSFVVYIFIVINIWNVKIHIILKFEACALCGQNEQNNNKWFTYYFLYNDTVVVDKCLHANIPQT